MSEAKSSDDDAVIATNIWNETVIQEFRANDGKLAGQFEGAPMLLLTTTGAKTCAARVNPMMYLIDDGRLFVFASDGGADTNPDWFYNLVADPSVIVEMGSEKFRATASPLSGEERDRVYAIQAERFSRFAEYQENTSRDIPVVELFRA